jgi:DNA-binding response OmpR family regulator
MLTAYGNESHKQRGAEIGVDRYLVKPIKPKDLLVYVNDLLGQSGEQT